MIRVENLCKSYPRPFGRPVQSVLDRVSFRVASGESFGLVGINGAGKTTTVKILLGLVQPTCGSARIAELAPADAGAKVGIAYIPELPAVYPFFTGRETLAFTARRLARDASRSADRIAAALDTVGLTPAADRPAGTYSKGMRVRLGFAQALLTEPSVMLLDEPTTGLDPVAVRHLHKLIARLRERGVTLVISSHDLRTVHACCDRIGLLHLGRLLECRTALDWARDGAGLEEAIVQRLAAEGVVA